MAEMDRKQALKSRQTVVRNQDFIESLLPMRGRGATVSGLHCKGFRSRYPTITVCRKLNILKNNQLVFHLSEK